MRIFPTIDREQWFQAVEASGREREELVSEIEGLVIKALYTEQDRLAESVEWVAQRGCGIDNAWEICQGVRSSEPRDSEEVD